MLFAASGFFLVVQFLLVLYNGFQSMKTSVYMRKENARISAQEDAQHLEEWLSFADKLSPEDRELILRFIETGNKPVRVSEFYVDYYIRNFHNSIYNTKAVVYTENRDCSRQYKLDEQFYKTMKAIYEERGSISHF